MDRMRLLKAIADETRMNILTLLLKHNYCVRALANTLALSEATISQHLKVLREAGLLVGERRGYFMHYAVERAVLRALAADIAELATTEHKGCTLAMGRCGDPEQKKCHAKNCGDQTTAFCHGEPSEHEGGAQHGSGQCQKS